MDSALSKPIVLFLVGIIVTPVFCMLGNAALVGIPAWWFVLVCFMFYIYQSEVDMARKRAEHEKWKAEWKERNR